MNPQYQPREGVGPVEDYLDLVSYIARTVSSKLVNVSYDDIYSYGSFGLLDAMTKFDASRGFKFQTYASQRIRGAIFDELRVIDWVPRSIRSKIKLYNETTAYLEVDLNRQPTFEEVAEELGLSVEEVKIISGHALQGQPLASLQFQKSNPDEEGVYTLEDEIEDREHTSSIDMEQIITDLDGAIDSLDERDQLMLALYYYDGKTLSEISRIMGMTESRACQIHGRTLAHLGKSMKHSIGAIMELER